MKKMEENRTFNWSWCCSQYELSGGLVGWYIVYSVAAAVTGNFHALNKWRAKPVCFLSNWFASLFYVHGFCHVNAGRVEFITSGKWNWIWCFEQNDRQISVVVMTFGPLLIVLCKKYINFYSNYIWYLNSEAILWYSLLHIASSMHAIPFWSDKSHKNINSIFPIW